MDKKSSSNKRSVIMSDKYVSESGLQGGKAISDHISLLSLIIGIPLLLIGIYGMLNMVLGWGYPTNGPIFIMVVLVLIIGLLMTLGGYSLYKKKNESN